MLFPNLCAHAYTHKNQQGFQKTQTTNNNNKNPKNPTKQSQNQNINSKKIQTTTKQQIQI